ncbi:phosphoenolpyruvate--protein phosphotransferase [Georgenia yuyongxinii]|uniref:Phosphoenolpyruvate-protein phosphotransferase n=1 Tax=Georgenia yuyongxinii TaxID=2589797 RepID=A0A5B8C0E1_9MICO|nr:phosphoenolpyruvate--protein phosphotransferase [Georgenia yuyongxinii]QDC24179.1 phosphoenolpyruvate--protein phosphotransferase [Georgenia yuyongxinii]
MSTEQYGASPDRAATGFVAGATAGEAGTAPGAARTAAGVAGTAAGSVRGVGVSPGLAAGPVARLAAPAGEPAIARLAPDADLDAEAARVTAAAEQVAGDLTTAAATVDGERRELLETTAQMAADPTLVRAAQQKVREHHLDPARAAWEAAGEVADQLRALGGYMAERARDVHDVRDRLIAVLTGAPMPGVPRRTDPFVLVAHDLAPADTALLDPTQVRGIVTAEGGPTSHTAILARALGIPAVVGAGDLAALTEGRQVLVDGGAGTVTLDPDDATVRRAAERAARVRTFDGAGRTADGHRVALLANVGDQAGAEAAAAAGAEGVGLFRTEFCFLDHTEEPSVEKQVAAYRPVLAAFPGRKVVVRTLDAGADKPLPFVTATEEVNPALGVRGLRTARRAPEVLDNQLEAIAQAAGAEDAEVWVMAPMVATVAETEEFVAACTRHGLGMAGVMVEVPSAALLAGPILARAHFASIGTNDLTQYAMAADRLLGSLADLSDSWQPAVLRLIEATCRGGAQQARPVGVCGEAAADPALAVVLVGLGVSSLSMTPRALADVAAVLAATDLERCRELARVAVDAESAQDARDAVRAGLPVLTEMGL